MPEEHWRGIKTNDPLERILREIRRAIIMRATRLISAPAASFFIGPNREMVIHNMDTEGGESGGPIFWTDGDRYFALAVHAQGVGLARGMNAGVP